MLSDRIAIDVKGSETVDDRRLAGMRALAEEVRLDRKIVVSSELEPRRTSDGIEILPVNHFLDQLWGDAFSV